MGQETKTPAVKRDKPFYGWYIVAAGFVLMAAAMGIATNCASLFINPVCEDLGFSRKAMGFNATIVSGVTMLVALFSSKLFAAAGHHRLMKTASITISLSVFAFSLADSLPIFYLLSAVTGASYALLASLSMSIILTNWFYERRGLALGLTFMGSAVGGMVFTAVAGAIIEGQGWRTAYKLLGIILAVTVIPSVFLIIKIRPEDKGLLPLGKKPEQKQQGGELMLKDAFKSPKFWAVCFGIMLTSMSMTTLLYTMAPHLNNIGYSVTFSANVSAAALGVLAFGKLAMGQLFDKAGTRRAVYIACILIFLGLIGMCFAKFKPALCLIILGVGFGCALGTVGYQLLVQGALSGYKFAAIYGFISAVSNLGGTIIPVINGAVYDAAGSYTPAMACSAAAVLLALLIFRQALRKNS